jgi:hypothetical protein
MVHRHHGSGSRGTRAELPATGAKPEVCNQLNARRRKRFLQFRPFGPRVVEYWADRRDDHPPVREWMDKIQDILGAARTAIEPPVEIALVQNDRHPVVNASHVGVCPGRQNRHCLDFAPVRPKPCFPDTSERKKVSILQADKMRLFRPSLAGPFVETARRYEASTAPHGTSE